MSDGQSFFLLVPGPWPDIRTPLRALALAGIPIAEMPGQEAPKGGVAVEMVEEQGGFGEVTGGPGFTKAVLVEVEGTLDARRSVVGQICDVLGEVGAVSLRFESSGRSHSIEVCGGVMSSGDLYEIVQAVVGFSFDGDRYFTTGLHQFARRDIEAAGLEEATAGRWLLAFSVFLIEEDPALANGHTFSPFPDAPRHALERWPDTRHRPLDGRHNPLGMWRALRPGQEGLDAVDQEFVSVPALVVLLGASESEAGRLLSRDEVESVVSRASGVLVDIADARQLERSRGFADILPERAWEQWQIVRNW